MDYVSPACAGMIPMDTIPEKDTTREPRMRGDDPKPIFREDFKYR